MPPIPSLFITDTTDIAVVTGGAWEWQWTRSDRAPGPPKEWYFTVVQQLEANGWGRDEWYTGGSLHYPVTYSRMINFTCVVVWERVKLDGGPYEAHVRMHRWITLPWWE